ncbi:MAG TPA: zf-HC2 domain-containing protein [Bryobacteraceae bacterium]|nr:zf-HC2 domain-containing protein [Bryobacteraceae bacterium]
MTHEYVQALLALSASGLLEADEERAVREHIRECGECAARLDELAACAEALSSLPAPSPSADLLARTQALMAAEAAAIGERRRGAIIAVGAGMVAWVANLMTWAVYQLITGGISAVVRPELSGLIAWLALSTLTACIAAPAAALASRHRPERSIL